MSKLYKIIAVMCIAALLCGCLNSGRLGNGADPSDFLASQPTNPTTQPTSPTTEPTQPPTQPPTEPSTEPTLPEWYICKSEEEAITVAAEFLQITDYQAECHFKTDYVPMAYGVSKYDRYIVTMDDGKYIYEVTVDPGLGITTYVTCTPKEGSVDPGGPALPPEDMTHEEVEEQYTVLYPAGEKDWKKQETKTIEVEIGLGDIPLGTAIDGITIRTSDGKPVFLHDGRVYIWESDNVFTYIGICSMGGNKILTYTLRDGSYEFIIDFDCFCIQIYYIPWLERFTAYWAFPINGTTLLEVSNYEKQEVKGFQVTENGKIEIVPFDTTSD